MAEQTDIVIESSPGPAAVAKVRRTLPFSFAKRHGVLIHEAARPSTAAAHRRSHWPKRDVSPAYR